MAYLMYAGTITLLSLMINEKYIVVEIGRGVHT